MPTDYVFLNTYRPTQCGLATFSAALLAHLPEPGDNVGVVRVLDEPAPQNSPLVVHDLINGSGASAADAVGIINGFDVAIVQHEYGIYGGPHRPDGLPPLDPPSGAGVPAPPTAPAAPPPLQRGNLYDGITPPRTVRAHTQPPR